MADFLDSKNVVPEYNSDKMYDWMVIRAGATGNKVRDLSVVDGPIRHGPYVIYDSIIHSGHQDPSSSTTPVLGQYVPLNYAVPISSNYKVGFSGSIFQNDTNDFTNISNETIRVSFEFSASVNCPLVNVLDFAIVKHGTQTVLAGSLAFSNVAGGERQCFSGTTIGEIVAGERFSLAVLGGLANPFQLDVYSLKLTRWDRDYPPVPPT